MKKLRIILLSFFILLVPTQNLFAGDDSSDEVFKTSRADSHAPIKVMGDHTHKANEFMISYRFMTMGMDGYQSGSSSSNYTKARTKPLGGYYMTVPEEMTMNMHMVGAMFAPSDEVTLMIMGSYLDSEMKVKKHMNGKKRTLESSGLGDTKVTVLRNLAHNDNAKLHLSLGLSIPTGSISKKDVMFGVKEETLGYNMQLGSGTYDALTGLTYVYSEDTYSYGAQISSVMRIGKNSKEYALGDIYKTTIWFAVPFNVKQTSFSISTELKSQTKISGHHKDIENIMSFAQDRDSSGSKRIDISLGINHIFNKIRAGVAYTIPTYNDVNGVQLDSENSLMFGLGTAF